MNPKKILVIDDQPDNVFLLKDRLNKEGINVLSAFNGENGIKLAEEEQPDLILLDVMMPDMDGFEVCSKISDSKKTKHIPIIMLTALNSADDIQKGFNSGAFDYIKKPYSKVELLARIKSALRFNETNKLLIELEKINTFTSTVKKTNHEIKQPLTLINLSVTALRREFENEKLNEEAALKRLEFIDSAVKEIISVMESMLKIKKPEVNDFLKNLKENEFKIGEEV